MQLNKYDLVDYLVTHIFVYIDCGYCPIRKECKNRDKKTFILCSDKNKIKETLIKKYNL